MPRINVYLEEKENKKLEKFCEVWNIKSKEDVIKRMIREFPFFDIPNSKGDI